MLTENWLKEYVDPRVAQQKESERVEEKKGALPEIDVAQNPKQASESVGVETDVKETERKEENRNEVSGSVENEEKVYQQGTVEVQRKGGMEDFSMKENQNEGDQQAESISLKGGIIQGKAEETKESSNDGVKDFKENKSANDEAQIHRFIGDLALQNLDATVETEDFQVLRHLKGLPTVIFGNKSDSKSHFHYKKHQIYRIAL